MKTRMAIFKISTGGILWEVFGSFESQVEGCSDGMGVYVGDFDQSKNWVEVTEKGFFLRDREAMRLGFRNGDRSVSVFGLPVPCEAKVDRERYEICDGVMEFFPETPGKYVIEFKAPRFLPRKEVFFL